MAGFWRGRRVRLVAAGLCLLAGVLGIMTGAGAQLPILGGGGNGLNDLAAIGQGVGQTPAKAPVQKNAEPPLTATPVAACGPGSKPEPGVDGRVPAGTGVNGLWCNTQLVAHQGTSGGFKTFRYVDAQGHVCAFYDTALLFPTNGINAAGPSLGVAVLDMSDPAHPVQTDTLTAPPMLSPHESLNLNAPRGLLAAVNGNPATEPGLVSIYDVHADCRHPVLDSTSLVARFGHESGFSPDGRTFYATATALPGITAIDVTDPKDPHAIWQGNVVSHGMSLSQDGNRAYIADPTGGDMLILDTSQIQARKPNPQAREVSRLTWASASIPQNAIPFTEHGHPYVLEFDEYTAGTLNPSASRDVVGAARIIDIADEAHPFVVSNLRLQIDQPAEHAAASGDPGTFSAAQGYAAHYCNIPSRTDPQLVACSFIASGLRLFDISDLVHPREVGYFVSPTTPNTETGYSQSDYAMSQPTFDTARHDIWYTDGGTGFYVVHVTNGAWPAAGSPLSPPVKGCPGAGGRLNGRRLGSVQLGMTRGQAERALGTGAYRHVGRHTDVSCSGTRVVYASSAVVRPLPRSARARRLGRVALILTTSRHYSLSGVRVGARLSAAARRLHLRHGLRTGARTWYVLGGRLADRVVEVRLGRVVAIGVADRLVAGRPAALRQLVAGTP